MPEFIAPQFDRNNMSGSGMTRNKANLIDLYGTTDGQERSLSAFGYTDYDPADDDELWWGLFEPDGTEIGRQQSTPSPNGTFRGGFSGFDPGPNNIAIEIIEPGLSDDIFADGFESGDTSAWSFSR